MRLLLLTLPLAALVGAVRRLDLTATDGEAAGKYAFNGGEEEATCKACVAVMQHVERQMADPMYDEKGYFAARKTRVAGSKEEQTRKLNLAARAQAVLDPKKCMEEMKKYDLGYTNGENNFVFKDPKKPMNYPVHMELNDWAKNELGTFCESLFEEKEDELTAAVMAADEEGGASLSDNAMKMCKDELDLCRPPPPPPPHKPPPPMSKAERLKKAEEVFKGLDQNSDGFVDKREIQAHTKNAQREGKLAAGTKVKDEVDKFFQQCDDNGDMKVDFEEYKQLWIKGKKTKAKAKARAAAALDDGTVLGFLRAYVLPELMELPTRASKLAEQARKYAKESPYVALSGVGVMSAAVYVGGMVVRVW